MDIKHTQIVGDAGLVQKRTVRAGSCRLVGFCGHNNGAADLFIQAHDTLDCSGQALLSVLAFKGLPYSFTLPAPVGFDRLVIAASDSADPSVYSAAAGTPVTIQAVLTA
jgi:hypothetical protein